MWHYRARKRKIGKETVYDVIEYYPPTKEFKDGLWTLYEISPQGSTKKELIRELEMMLHGVCKHSTLDPPKETREITRPPSSPLEENIPPCICSHSISDHNNADHCSLCTCKIYEDFIQ